MILWRIKIRDKPLGLSKRVNASYRIGYLNWDPPGTSKTKTDRKITWHRLPYRVRTLLSYSNSMTFHDFLHDLFTLSKTMCSAVSFKKSKTFPCFRLFATLNSSTDTNTGVHQNACRLRRLITLFCLYIVLALSSAVTNLSHKTFIFHDFQGPTIKFH